MIQSAIKPHGNRFRPIADLQPSSAMLRCGPSVRTFAARAKFEDGRTHSVRTNRPDASAAIAYAAFLRICGKLIAALQPGSWKRPFNGTNYGEFQTDSSPDHVR